MANKRIPDLTAASTLADADLAVVDQGGAESVKATLQSLRQFVLTATNILGILENTRTGGGTPYTNLAGELATYIAAAGGEPIEPATGAEIRQRAEGNTYYTPTEVETAWTSVNLAPSSGVITVDGSTFLRAHSVITANSASTPTNMDGEKRFHTITASGGNFTYTPSVAGRRGFDELTSFLIFDGESVEFSYYVHNGDIICQVERGSNDRAKEVILTPVSDAITVSTAVPAKFRTPPLSAALTINAGTLTGRTIEGRIGPASGADQTVTVSGWTETYGTTSGAFTVPAGKTVKIACEAQNGANILRVLATSAAPRAVPTFVSYAQSSSGAAVSPTSLVGDLALILDGRAATAPPDLPSGATEIAALTGGIGTGFALRASWQEITSDNQTIAAASNASRRIVLIIRGADLVSPIIATAKTATTTTAASIPALSLPQAGLVVAGIGVDNVTTTPTLLSPLTVRVTNNPTNSPHTVGDTAGLVTEFAKQDFTLATAEAAIGYAIGILGKVI